MEPLTPCSYFIKFSGACLLAFAFSLPTMAQSTLNTIQSTGTIKIGVREEAFPFAFWDQNKKPLGYTVDICEKVVEAVKRELKRPDLKVEYIPVTPASRIPAISSGEIDLECGVTTNNAARRQHIDFAITTFIAEVRLLVRRQSSVKSVVDLLDKKVIVTKGTTSETILNDLNKRLLLDATAVYTDSNADSFNKFEEGDVDAFILDDIQLYAQRAISKNPEEYVITTKPLSLEPIAIGLRKDDPEFKKLVNDEVARIITEGEIHTIYKKWFESSIPEKQGINLKYPMTRLLKDSFKSPNTWVPN